MMKIYKRKTNGGDRSEENMKNTVDSVVEGKMGYLLAAKTFSVPKTTLERKVKVVRDSFYQNVLNSPKLKVQLGPKNSVFSADEEEELCSYILDMEKNFYGLMIKDLRGLIYKLAVKNNKPHPFYENNQLAGKDWVQNFLKRHPKLSIRQPESTSAAHAAGFNKQSVNQYFNLLGNIYDEHQLTPDRAYNCDETGISIVAKSK